MKLFISGEVSPGVGQGLRESAVTIMDTVNPQLANKTYGDTVRSWYFLPIILDEPVPGFEEVEYYNANEQYLEFKKNLDFSTFLAGNSHERCRHIFQALVRSITTARGMGVSSFSFDDFERDLVAIGLTNAWL